MRMVPAEGVEPPHHKALDPKSSVSTNSTTRLLLLESSTLCHKFLPSWLVL